MKVTIRHPISTGEKFILETLESVDDIKVNKYSIMSIDGSTTNTGIAIISESDSGILYSLSVEREKDTEEPVRYKIRLKKLVQNILSKNRLITQVYYEEPVIANPSAVKNLFMLRSFIEEMIIENEPDFYYIKHYEVSNIRWKTRFLRPDKLPSGTEKQKEAVRKKLLRMMPFLEPVTQDEVDAICLGAVACANLKENNDGDDLQSHKKPRPFKFNIEFIGANSDDEMTDELLEVYSGPDKLLENGLALSEINSKTNFENYIYKTMGDDDKILIIKFKSSCHGDVILKYRVGRLAQEFDYIYAVVWRTNRKN